jgi:hypothetical protein
LADAAKITPDECRKSLKALMSPDPDSTSKDHEGRRIVEVPEGWQIVNSDLYRFSTEAKRACWAQDKAEQRARADAKSKPKRKPRKLGELPGERSFVKAEERGESPNAEDYGRPLGSPRSQDATAGRQ